MAFQIRAGFVESAQNGVKLRGHNATITSAQMAGYKALRPETNR
jgi:hypothetical protein